MHQMINRRNFIKTLGLLSFTSQLQFHCSSTNKKPNIILFLVDDLGWRDLGCYGSTFYETPNVDKFAENGVKFTQAYSASAVCSPTRASLMTGKHPARLHLTDWLGPDEWRPEGRMDTPEIVQHLVHEERTIAEVLEENGYHTCLIGKWHLGEEDYYPENHGFETNIAGNAAGAPPSYFYPYERKDWEGTGWPVRLNNLPGGKKGEYLTDRLTEEAEAYIESNADNPFFLMLSHYAVHKPFQAKEQHVKKYKTKKAANEQSEEIFEKSEESISTRQRQDHAIYAGMVQSVDESFGRIVKKLETLGISDETIVIFSSDNGGLSTSGLVSDGGWLNPEDVVTSNLPLRAGKGWYYEGGIRIPTIISWPEKIDSGVVSDELITSTDLYPTILELAGIGLNRDQHIDGTSYAGHLTEGRPVHRETLFWHYPHYINLGQNPVGAVRHGDFKLIEHFEDQTFELYNLKDDIGERHNLIDQLPEKAEQLKELLQRWRRDVNAQMPSKNLK